MKIIGLEEHCVIPEVLQAWRSLDPQWQDLALKASSEGEGGRRLLDFALNASREWTKQASTCRSCR